MLFLITIVLGGSAIFIGYRLSQEEEITPEESEAAGGAGSCCHPDVGCIAGWECVETDCEECINPIGSSGCDGFGSGVNCIVCNGGRCPIWPGVIPQYTCEGGKCCVYDAWTCVKRDDCTLGNTECASWFRDNKSSCEWPKVLFSGRPNGDFDVCRCGVCGGAQDPLDACSGNPPGVNDRCCDLGGCPSGYVSCGDSTNHEGGNCEKMEDISCTVFHPDCNNPSVIYRYCKSTQSDLECGDNCAGLEDDDCEGDLYCETTPDDGRLCLGADWRDCDVQEHIANDCSCPTPIGCGDVCEEDDDCEGDLICEKFGNNSLCVGADFEECELQEHLDNSCSCPEETLDCESLTVGGTGVIKLTQGESATEILDAASSGTADEGLIYDFGVESGFGTIDPSTQSGGSSAQASWSISTTETAALSAGHTYENKIWVSIMKEGIGTFGGAESEVCSIDLQVAAGNANFNTEKAAVVVCSEDNTEAFISYEISFTNVANFQTLIMSVEDVYDESIDGDWLDNIDPNPDLHSGGSILWDNEGYGFLLDSSDSKIITYEVTVPAKLFGETLHNIATIIPEIGEPIVLEEDVIVRCTLPPTGIMDKTGIVVLYALFFLVTGTLTVRYFGALDFIKSISTNIWPISVIADNVGWNKKQRFERKIVKEVDDKIEDR